MGLEQLTKSRKNPFLALLGEAGMSFSRRRKEDSRRVMEEQTLLKILEMWGLGLKRKPSNNAKDLFKQTPFDAISGLRSTQGSTSALF